MIKILRPPPPPQQQQQQQQQQNKIVKWFYQVSKSLFMQVFPD